MHIFPRGAVAFACLAIPMAPSALFAGQRSLADVAPRDSLFYISIDVERAAEKWRTIDLVRLYGDAEVQAFIAPVIESVTAEAEFKQMMAAKFLVEQYGLPDIIDGKIEIVAPGYHVRAPGSDAQGAGESIWLRGSDPLPQSFFAAGSKSIDPELVMLIDTAGQESFGASWERVLELDPSIEVSQGETSGQPWSKATIPAGLLGNDVALELYSTFIDDLFLVAMRDSRLFEVASALRAEAPAESLAKEEGFQRFTAHSLRGTELMTTWIAGGPMLSKIIAVEKQGGVQGERTNLETLGFDKVAGVGFTIGLDDGRICDSLAFVLPKERSGLLRIADALQPGSKIVDSVRKGAAAHLELRADVARVYDVVLETIYDLDPSGKQFVEAGIAEVSATLGCDLRKDLIASLGSDFLISVALPKSGFIPEVTGWVELKDAEKFATIVETLKKLVVEQSRGRMEFAELALKDGNPGFYLKSNDLAGVAPSFAVREGKLLFSLSTSSLKRLTLAISKPPAEGAALSEDLSRSLKSTVGEDVGSIAGMIYIDLAASTAMGLATAEPFLAPVLAGAPIPLDATKFPAPDTIASYLSGMLYTLRFGHDVISIDSSSPFGGFAMFLPAAAVGAASFSSRGARADLDRSGFDPDQPYIGVLLAPTADDAAGGIVVSGVSPGTPAATAGILVDDVIRMVDGKPVGNASELSNALLAAGTGSTAELTIERDGERRAVKVFVGRRGDFIR